MFVKVQLFDLNPETNQADGGHTPFSETTFSVRSYAVEHRTRTLCLVHHDGSPENRQIGFSPTLLTKIFVMGELEGRTFDKFIFAPEETGQEVDARCFDLEGGCQMTIGRRVNDSGAVQAEIALVDRHGARVSALVPSIVERVMIAQEILGG